MNKPKLWLHIGIPKTGTTAFQSFCMENRERLKREGILYPSTGRPGVAHHELAWSITDVGPDIDSIVYEKLLDEVKASSCNDVIISSEVFFITPRLGQLRSLLDVYDVNIIVFLRHQLIWYPSMYQQYIKQNEYRINTNINDTEIMKIPYDHLDYYQQMLNWARSFGEERLHVSPYPDAYETRKERKKLKAQRDTISQIFKIMGRNKIARWKRPLDVGQTNISLKPDELELVKLSNGINYGSEDRSRLLYALQKTAARRHETDRISPIYYLPEDDIIKIKDEACVNNDKLSQFSKTTENKFFDSYPDLDDDFLRDLDLTIVKDSLLEIGSSLYIENLNYAQYKFQFDMMYANQLLGEVQNEVEGIQPFVMFLNSDDSAHSKDRQDFITLLLGSCADHTFYNSDGAIFAAKNGKAYNSFNVALRDAHSHLDEDNMVIFTNGNMITDNLQITMDYAPGIDEMNIIRDGDKPAFIIVRLGDLLQYTGVIMMTDTIEDIIERLSVKFELNELSPSQPGLIKLNDDNLLEHLDTLMSGAS